MFFYKDVLFLFVFVFIFGVVPPFFESALAQTEETSEAVPEKETADEEKTETENITASDVKSDSDEEPGALTKPLRKRNRPVRAKLPKGLFGAEPEKSPEAEETVLGGTVPAIWEIDPKSSLSDDDDFSTILDRDSIAPAVPGKVVRYAIWLMQQYDADGDGRLQESEWKKMSGSPQAIDVDGDRIITLDELVRFLGLYGNDRTIHRPYPVQRYHEPRMLSSQLQLFKPITSAPEKPVAPQASVDAQNAVDAQNITDPKLQAALDTKKDLTEDALESAEMVVDDATYEEIVAGRQVPAEKKYHTPKETLYGVPAWFIVRDRNGDGQVSLMEFAPSMTSQALSLFGRLDKNGDGFITPDEVRVQPIQSAQPTSAAPSTP